MSKPIVVIVCMLSSSESWEPQTAPTSLALTCRWRSRPQHQYQIGRITSITSSARATSIFRRAALVAADVPDAAFDLLRAGNAHAFASAREALIDYSVTLPGSKVLADAYGVN